MRDAGLSDMILPLTFRSVVLLVFDAFILHLASPRYPTTGTPGTALA